MWLDNKTFDQMKNSDVLKLIEPRKISDSICDYYQSLQFFNSQSALQRQKVVDIQLVNSQLFDGYVFQQMFSKVEGSLNVDIAQPENDPPLLSDDFNAVNKVMIAYHYLYGTTEINNKAAEKNKQHALRLIDLLKEEYHLK
jgi:hypothetical protein